MLDDRVWYAEGLHFECKPDCANCCVNHGNYAYVYLDDGEVRRLARHLGLTLPEFKKRYTEREDGDLILAVNHFTDGYTNYAYLCDIFRNEATHADEDAHRALSEFAHDRRRLYPARDTLRSLRSQVSVPEATDLDVALDLIEERIQS